MKPEQVAVRDIKVAADRLKPDEKIVKQLMESISKTGLINPITLCRVGSVLRLVAGGSRLEAYKRLKLSTIAARVETGDTPEVQQWCELAEIDENLIRRDLSPALRSKLIAHRKEVYNSAYPDAPRGRGGDRKTKSSGTRATFVKETAEKAGLDENTIHQIARHGRILGAAALDKIAGTSLDTESELKALARMEEAERKEVIARAAKGEKVSARKPREPDDDTPTREEIEDANTTARSRIFLRFAADALRKIELGAGLKKSKRGEITPEIKKALNDLVRACTKLRDDVLNRKE